MSWVVSKAVGLSRWLVFTGCFLSRFNCIHIPISRIQEVIIPIYRASYDIYQILWVFTQSVKSPVFSKHFYSRINKVAGNETPVFSYGKWHVCLLKWATYTQCQNCCQRSSMDFMFRSIARSYLQTYLIYIWNTLNTFFFQFVQLLYSFLWSNDM